MAFVCCLAGIERKDIPMFGLVLRAAGVPGTALVGNLDVGELGTLKPALLVCDVDGSDVDGLELLRQLRFVLPDCLLAVYTGVVTRTWGVACHLAGVNCMLTKNSRVTRLAAGIRGALRSGCYTDPEFSAA
jgi:DNA-binding NarL/FixJ family response regulator